VVASLGPLPWLHPQIHPADLQTNGLLLSEKQMAWVKHLIKHRIAHAATAATNDVSLRFSKRDLNTQAAQNGMEPFSFSVLYTGGKMYFVYHGAKKGKSVGAGSFGSTKLAQREDGVWVIIKIIKFTTNPGTSPELYSKEKAKIESEYSHIIRVYQADYPDLPLGYMIYRGKGADGTLNQGAERTILITPLFHGEELKKLLITRYDNTINFSFTTRQWMELALSLVEKVIQFDQKNYIHHDIKPENFIVNTGRWFPDHQTTVAHQARLIDFGLSTTTPSSLCVGTDVYIAPEMFEGPFVEHDQKADVYSLGATLAMLFGLYTNGLGKRIIPQNSMGIFKPADHQARNEVFNMLSQMMQEAPENRPSLEKIKDDLRALLDQSFSDDILKKIALVPIQSPYTAIDDGEMDRFMQQIASSGMGIIQFVDQSIPHRNPELATQRLFFIRAIEDAANRAGLLVSDQFVETKSSPIAHNTMQRIAQALQSKYTDVDRQYFFSEIALGAGPLPDLPLLLPASISTSTPSLHPRP
jgi:serine/threonine protein kinase